MFKEIIRDREIKRLCHFTPAKNLESILQNGILCSEKVPSEIWIDEERFDGKTGYVCTSIQYPNVYYLNNAIQRLEIPIQNWVIIEIDPYIIDEETLFSPSNAATKYGKYIKQGVEGFSRLFDESVPNRDGSRNRNSNWLNNATTDIQAEVLIPDAVPVEAIKGVVFHEEYDGYIPDNLIKTLGIRKRKSTRLFETNMVNLLDIGKFPYDFEF